MLAGRKEDAAARRDTPALPHKRYRVRAMELRVAKLKDEATLPSRAHEGDAGLDLYACEAAHLGPGERWSVGTGVAVEIPGGHAGLVLPRSGLARDHGIALVNSPGLIDAGTGEKFGCCCSIRIRPRRSGSRPASGSRSSSSRRLRSPSRLRSRRSPSPPEEMAASAPADASGGGSRTRTAPACGRGCRHGRPRRRGTRVCPA